MARIVGTGGDDYVTNPFGEWYAPAPVIALSTDGADQIYTLGGNDYVEAFNGNDRVDLGAGDDLAYGDEGNDWITGQAGNDRIWGDSPGLYADDPGVIGNDQLFGGFGDDVLYGEGGDDRLSGGPGNDTLIDREGNNTLIGGEGDDYLAGGVWYAIGYGNNRHLGGAGNDTLIDYGGVNRLEGGAGNDSINGVGTLIGGAGNDWLSAAGTSTMNGGPGADAFLASSNLGNGIAETITIQDFRPGEGDRISLHAFINSDPANEISGQALFDAYDTDRNFVIDARDAFSEVRGGALQLHDWEDTTAFRDVARLTMADWITG